MTDWLRGFRERRDRAKRGATPLVTPITPEQSVDKVVYADDDITASVVVPPPPPAKARTLKFRPYQVAGRDFLFDNKRAILADAPGLGKTFQAAEAAELPCVISCPLNLVEQWRDFLEQEYDYPVTVAAYGDVIKRDAKYNEFAAKGGWLIVNHDSWRQLVPPAAKTVIVDEFHHFRNREARRSVGLRIYAHKTERVYGLTATPVFKDIGDLYHLLHIVAKDNPNWRNYQQFLYKYAITDATGYGQRVVRVRSMRQVERDTEPYILARTYATVGMYLPERIDKHVVLHMKDEDRKRYAKLRDYYRLEVENEPDERFFNAGAVLHALRQLTVTKEKIDAVKQIIDDTPGEAPIIVFCWYRSTAAVLAKALDAAEITGAVSPAERRDLANGMEGQRVRVVTMQSLSEGVDLSDSRTVIYVEETYVPGQQYQSLTRVLRFRTDRSLTAEEAREPVVAYWVRYNGTVDSVVHRTARDRVNGNAMTVLREAVGID